MYNTIHKKYQSLPTQNKEATLGPVNLDVVSQKVALKSSHLQLVVPILLASQWLFILLLPGKEEDLKIKLVLSKHDFLESCMNQFLFSFSLGLGRKPWVFSFEDEKKEFID